jgi:hypothetical protein
MSDATDLDRLTRTPWQPVSQTDCRWDRGLDTRARREVPQARLVCWRPQGRREDMLNHLTKTLGRPVML